MPFAIGLDHTKTEVNVGTLMRSAYNFGASLIFTVGKRYKKQASDTTYTSRHIPILHFKTWEEYADHAVPWEHFGVEITPDAIDIRELKHPTSAVYLFGPEDGNLTNRAKSICKQLIKIPSRHCLNLAVCGSIVMYDRIMKVAK